MAAIEPYAAELAVLLLLAAIGWSMRVFVSMRDAFRDMQGEAKKAQEKLEDVDKGMTKFSDALDDHVSPEHVTVTDIGELKKDMRAMFVEFQDRRIKSRGDK